MIYLRIYFLIEAKLRQSRPCYNWGVPKLAFRALILSLILFFLLIFFESFQPFDEVIFRTKRKSERGIYITHHLAQTPQLFNSIRQKAKASGINTIVVDGDFFLQPQLLSQLRGKKIEPDILLSPNPWFTNLIKKLHNEGFIVTVRLVVFKDDQLAKVWPDLAIQNGGGGLYRDGLKEHWADPYSKEVHLYKVLLAERAALCGADEIQFDYIRFPVDRAASQAIFPFEQKELSRVAIISSFLKLAKQRLRKYNVSLAADVFGAVAWQLYKDQEALGQDFRQMAQYLDVISPMLYPSHFHNGYDNFANPGEHPYYFLSTGLKKTQELLSGETVAIVPWLQGFNLKSPNFGPSYILEQIKACEDNGIRRFLIWNARNDYSTSFDALKAK